MKNYLLCGFVAVFAAFILFSCDSDKPKTIDEILVELKDENPDRMALNIAQTNLFYKQEGVNSSAIDHVFEEYGEIELRMSGVMGDDTATMNFWFGQLCENISLGYSPSPYEFKEYLEGFSSSTATIECVNAKSGYLLISVRKEKELIAIFEGYLRGFNSECSYSGFMYTKDSKVAFAFEDDPMLWGN